MKLRPIKANMAELQLGDTGDDNYDVRVLFSYQTPVAYSVVTPEGRLYFRTNVKYSQTTTRHINNWLPKDLAEEVEQYVIDNVVEGNGQTQQHDILING